MPRENRKARATVVGTNPNLLQPLDLSKIGTQDDPCFGKLNDPQHEACRACGDFEICAIVQSQTNHSIRASWEKDNAHKVINEPPQPKAPSKKGYIIRLKKKGYSSGLIKKKLIKKFQITESLATKLLKKYA